MNVSRRSWLVFLVGFCAAVAGALIYWFTRAPAPRFVGDASCVSCHAEIAASYALTAHARTSSRAAADTIHGNFSPGMNVMRTRNASLHFRMDSDGQRFTQTAVTRSAAGETVQRSAQIDVVIGSGRKGQTYLHWAGEELFQLPVTYWAEQRLWVNSPGFVDGEAKFDRPIPPRCLECHASSIVSRQPPANRYVRDSLRVGLSCEKCHGPGSEHVAAFQKQRRSPSPTSLIVNPAKLSRERSIDACALCHAGEGRAVTPPLSYKPGDILAEHIKFLPQPPTAVPDVHANQVQLLQRSRCFQQSPTMTCITCHNVHQPQRDIGAMARSCRQCHAIEDCGKFSSMGAAIAMRCVDCHMPEEQTAQIIIAEQGGRTLQPKVRNHCIAVYPEQTTSP